MRTPTHRQLVVDVVRYGIGLVAFAWLFGQVEFTAIAGVLSTVGPRTVLALLAVTGIGLVARFYMWRVLIDRVARADLLTAARVDLVVNFVNQLLPSRLSGRAAAPLVVRSETGMEYPEAIAVAGVHTGLYAALYGVGALVGLAFGFGRLSPGLIALLGLSASLYLVAGAVVLLAGTTMGVVERLTGVLSKGLRRVPIVGESLARRSRSLPAFTEASAGWFRTLSSDPRVLLVYAAGFAGAMLFAPGLRLWLLFSSLGTSVEPAPLIPLYLLAAYSVTLLPVTPGGIGVSEATATAVFVALGVPATVVVPVVFVDRFLGVYLPALAGWYPSVRLDVARLVAD